MIDYDRDQLLKLPVIVCELIMIHSHLHNKYPQSYEHTLEMIETKYEP